MAANTARDDLAKLDSMLEAERGELEMYERYFCGKHPLAFATPKWRATFGNLFREFEDNWCPLVINATAERMEVKGFRFGEETTADADAWDMWRANYLDEDQDPAHVEALKFGRAATIITPGAGDEGGPRITVETPLQVVVASEAGDRRKRRAALKKWLDDSGYIFATLYRPDGVFKFQSKDTVDAIGQSLGDAFEWVGRAGVDFYVPNPLKVVPVVPLSNSPTLMGYGISDLREVIRVQDAVNKLLLDMIVAAEYAGFPQRWATGIEIPEDEDGNPSDKWLSFAGRVWTAETDEARFGEFTVADLRPYVNAIEMLIQHLAARTRTPPHYLLGQSGAFPSGESLKSTETGLVAKTKGKFKSIGGGWGESVRLGTIANGKPDPGRARTLWVDPESRTLGETIDAALKMADLGVPQEVLWERVGASPEEIERWKELRQKEQADLLTQAFFGAGPGGTPGGTPGQPHNPAVPTTPGTFVPPTQLNFRLKTG